MSKRRRSPRRHTVHPRHPRYTTDQYDRGKGNPPERNSAYPQKGDPGYNEYKTRDMILFTLHKSDIPGGLKEYIVSQNIEYWSVRWGNDDLFDYAIMKRGVRKEARKLAEEGILKKTALREDRYMLTKKGEKAAEKAYTRQTLG